ncbi:MAG: hypothetical protein AAF787_04040 [Chloroflexota bacterium]
MPLLLPFCAHYTRLTVRRDHPQATVPLLFHVGFAGRAGTASLQIRRGHQKRPINRDRALAKLADAVRQFRLAAFTRF